MCLHTQAAPSVMLLRSRKHLQLEKARMRQPEGSGKIPTDIRFENRALVSE